MYILRRDDSDTCTKGLVSCAPSFAIVGSDPSEKEDDDSFGPSDYGKPGPHRFIGIGMVAGMIFLVLVAYAVWGRWPRQMRRKYCRCLGGGGKEEAVLDDEREAGAMKQVAVVLETTSSTSSASSEEKGGRHHPRTSSSTRVPHSSRSEPNVDSERKPKLRRDSSRRRSRSRHGRGSRTADGAVMHVTKKAREVDGEPGNMVTGWEVEHVRAVHYEVSPRLKLFLEFHRSVDCAGSDTEG